MKTIKLTLTCIIIIACNFSNSQSNVNSNNKSKDLLSIKIEGIDEGDTLSIAELEKITELKVSEAANQVNTVSELIILKYSIALIPKNNPAEFYSMSSNQMSVQFIQNLKKNTGIIKIIFDEMFIQNNINGEVKRYKPITFFVKN